MARRLRKKGDEGRAAISHGSLIRIISIVLIIALMVLMHFKM